MEQKKSQKIRILVLIAILCLVMPTFCMASSKQNREQEQAERNETLWMVNDINNFCKTLTANIKTLEAEDSLNDIVWEHRDSLDKLSKDTLELFLSKFVSSGWYAPVNMVSMNTATWKDAACKQVAVNVHKCNSIKQAVVKTYDDILWKKQRILDLFLTVSGYSKNPADTPAEIVERMLDSPETCSFIGKQHVYYINALKAFLEMLEKTNSKNKEVLLVTDEDLTKMFGND